MKIKITFKDPDGVYDCIQDAAKDSLNMLGLNDAERAMLLESRHDAISAALKPWIRHGEYITIKFDTDSATATVLMA